MTLDEAYQNLLKKKEVIADYFNAVEKIDRNNFIIRIRRYIRNGTVSEYKKITRKTEKGHTYGVISVGCYTIILGVNGECSVSGEGESYEISRQEFKTIIEDIQISGMKAEILD